MDISLLINESDMDGYITENYKNANRWNGKATLCKPQWWCYTSSYPWYVMTRKTIERQLCNSITKWSDKYTVPNSISDDMYYNNTYVFRSCKTLNEKDLITIVLGNI